MATQITLQPGPQTVAARSKARIIFYGGARGGGKTRWLVHESARHCENPRYGAVIFRRTYPELRGIGSLWEECAQVYPHLGAEMVDSALKAKFPSGATVQLSHLQHEKDAKQWQGKSLPCVGFDELTHFTEQQFWMVFSSMRTTAGVAPRIRATMNPDPDSWVLQFVQWYIDEAGFPIPERSGVVRWFGRIDGKLRWFESEQDAQFHGIEQPISFTFIAANVFDNPALMKADPEYVAKLKGLPPVEQARFLGGNWRVRAAAGDYFQESWFLRIPQRAFDRRLAGLPDLSKDLVHVWRAWDFASTPVEGDTVIGAPRETRTTAGVQRSEDPDWTRSVKLGRFRDGRLCMLDYRGARDTPGAIEWWLKRTAQQDGKHVVQVMWQDPAQAGVHQATLFQRLLSGVARSAFSKTMNPLDVAGIASRAVHRGQVLVPEHAPWFEEFVREAEAFPNGNHDDGVSAFGLGCVYDLEVPGAGTNRIEAPGVHRLETETQPRVESHWAERALQNQDRAKNDMRGVNAHVLSGRFRIF